MSTMGNECTETQREKYLMLKLDLETPRCMSFDSFTVLRAIGKGSFSKVCVVQKVDTKKLYAMKYLSKEDCVRHRAVKNVLREVHLLQNLQHGFLINLRFAFQDNEDLFMVFDLYTGGDLRYHLQQSNEGEHPDGGVFTASLCKMYLCEMALALEYLKSKRVIHRDIKPDNILLCERGYLHLGDFNVATVLETNHHLATSTCGTKPYMAPEIFETALDLITGYSYSVDWWSLGVVLYELFTRERPFEIDSQTGTAESLKIIKNNRVQYRQVSSSSHQHSTDMATLMEVICELLQTNPTDRLQSLDTLKAHRGMMEMPWDAILARQEVPAFIPPKNQVNCDPTYELEEIMIETRPLYKKKKRLASAATCRKYSKKCSLQPQDEDVETTQALQTLEKEFPYFESDS